MNELRRRATHIIAGRQQIPAADAVTALGRYPTPATIDDLSHSGIVADDAGMVNAADVLRAIDRKRAAQRARRRPVFDANVELRRLDQRAWSVWLNGADLGDIEVAAVYSAPIATPANFLPVWIAETADGETRFGAVSARAAQWLLVARSGAQMNPPAWAKNARELDTIEILTEVQRIGDEKGRHLPSPLQILRGDEPLPEPEYSSDLLTRWEINEITPTTRPTAMNCSRPETFGRVGTPSGLTLTSRNNHKGLQWTIGAVAEFLQVANSTVEAYRSRGQMPEPDGMTGRTPWWHPATIREWAAQRQRPRK